MERRTISIGIIIVIASFAQKVYMKNKVLSCGKLMSN